MTKSAFESMMADDGLAVLNEWHGVYVVLFRGASNSDEFYARRRTPETMGVIGPVGIAAKSTEKEFFLPKASCVVSGVEVKPEVGNIVKEGDDRWEIFDPNDERLPVVLVRESEWKVQTRLIEN